MTLSLPQIEEIAVNILAEFKDNYGPKRRRKNADPARPVPIEKLATEHLGLEILYAPLPAEENIWGLTAYTDTEYRFMADGAEVVLPMKKNQIVLSSLLIQNGMNSRLHTMYRFTLAHECAHQILFQLANAEAQDACQGQYAERRSYSLRELKTREDWNEWQANALGAALLMPKEEIARMMRYRFWGDRKITSYGGFFCRSDRWAIRDISMALDVSKSAAIIRLRGLGYLVEAYDEDYIRGLEAI